MKQFIHSIFRFHVALVIVLWATLWPVHIHLSGYGLTNYLEGTNFLQPIFGWIPGANAYNTISNCGLPLCGYPLTQVFHTIAGGLVALTVSLLFATFMMGWYCFFSFSSVATFVLGWEYWEVARKVTRCRPEDYATIAAACNEMMRIISDQVNDIIGGFIGALIVLAVLYVVDRHSLEIKD